MKDIKFFLTNLLLPYEKIWTIYMAAVTILAGICFNIFLALKFHWVMIPSHPMFPFFIGTNFMFLLCFLIFILESFYQRLLVRFLAPFYSQVKTNDLRHFTYMEYHQMFSQIFPLNDHLAAIKKRYLPFLYCSRFLMILLYLTILFLCGTADYFFSRVPVVKTSFCYYHFFIIIALIIYLLLIMHLNTSKLPDMPQANKWFFFILIVLYITVKSVSLKQNYTFFNDSEPFMVHIINFTENALFPLLLICLYFNVTTSKYICFDIRQKLNLYDTFMGAYISFSDILYTLETDTETLALLCRYSAYKDHKSETIHITSNKYPDEKMHWLLSQQDLLLECCYHFSGDMLSRCQQIFQSLPDWSLCLMDEDFPNNMIQFLEENR